MRVLVTGASSLIGRGVAGQLAGQGDDVRCFQRHRIDALAHESIIEQMTGDVTDRDAVDRAMEGCDAVVHLAAKVGVVGSRAEFMAVNVDGTRHVIESAQEAGIAKFVHVSSPSVAHDGSPIVGGAADDPVLAHGSAWYPESKAVAERLALSAVSDSFGVVVIRPHLVWGPGDTQLVGRILDRARSGRLALVGGGTALIDTTYIDNAVDALVAALDAVEPAARCSGQAYVIANGEPRPVRELVQGICEAAGVTFDPHDVPLGVARRVGGVVERLWPRLGRTDDPPITRFLADQLGTAHWFDPRPARDDLGWSPSVSIDEGLRRLAESFSDAPGASL